MFGVSYSGFIGAPDMFLQNLPQGDLLGFLFQMTFCATAATIVPVRSRNGVDFYPTCSFHLSLACLFILFLATGCGAVAGLAVGVSTILLAQRWYIWLAARLAWPASRFWARDWGALIAMARRSKFPHRPCRKLLSAWLFSPLVGLGLNGAPRVSAPVPHSLSSIPC